MPHQSHSAPAPQKANWLNKMFDISVAPPQVNVGLLERLVSLAVGAMLVLASARRFVLYLGLAVAGGFLLYRGVTGYCPFYAAEQIDTRNWDQKLLGFGRSKHNEQDNHARQMAPGPWHAEDEMGQPDRR